MTITSIGLATMHAARLPAVRTTKMRGDRLVTVFPQGDRVKFDTADGDVSHGRITECLEDDFYLVRSDDEGGRTRVVHAEAIWPF